jgi:hypothetical protein
MPTVEWSHDLGGYTAGQTIQTSDRGFISAGNFGSSAYVVKSDSSGSTSWSKQYLAPGATGIVQTNDGGFAVCTGGSATVIKIDSSGAQSWKQTYSGGSFTSIAKTSDGSLIATGPKSGPGTWDYYVVKIDNSGNKMWDSTLDTGGYDWPSHIIETNDHQVLVVGAGYSDIWMVKLDISSGSKIWDKPIGGTGNDNAGWVIQNEDNSYVVCGSSNSYSSSTIGYLAKVDSTGIEIWHHTYSAASDAGFASLAKTEESGYLLIGVTGASSNDKTWLLETDSTGIMIWQNELSQSSGGSIQRTSDGGYILGNQIGATQASGMHIIKLAAGMPLSKPTPLAHTQFVPNVNGFGFDNTYFTDDQKKSISEASVDVSNEIQQSALGNVVPSQFYQTIGDLAIQFANIQKGYCGGMVRVAKQYYLDPMSLPSGFSSAAQISSSNIPQDTRSLIWREQWVTQTLSSPGILKFWALSLGTTPSGLVPFNDEVSWIISELDQGKPVSLALFQQDPWDVSHCVLAYDYLKLNSRDLYLYVYGPNYGNQPNSSGINYKTDSVAGQTIHLTLDSSGNYAIANGEIDIEGMRFFRIGATESSLGVSWQTLGPHLGEIIEHQLTALAKIVNNVVGIEAHSPVTLMLTTPTGQHIGYNSTTNRSVNDLMNAIYSGPAIEPQIIAIINSTVGSYSIDITGTDSGSYTINAFKIGSSGIVTQNLTVTGSTFQGKIDHTVAQLSDNGDISINQITNAPSVPEVPLISVLALSFAATIISILLKKRKIISKP